MRATIDLNRLRCVPTLAANSNYLLGRSSQLQLIIQLYVRFQVMIISEYSKVSPGNFGHRVFSSRIEKPFSTK